VLLKALKHIVIVLTLPQESPKCCTLQGQRIISLSVCVYMYICVIGCVCKCHAKHAIWANDTEIEIAFHLAVYVCELGSNTHTLTHTATAKKMSLQKRAYLVCPAIFAHMCHFITLRCVSARKSMQYLSECKPVNMYV